ncbi:outer membrane porin, OprD family [Azotobacter beijerinckii]|uniref:Outer membrane porin, OprD family n=1 Tax=Azotobacter beijerinckii TaxID=170623 RepID=A0A1H6TY54_9GAMM|nr:OprD family porin [Azotobacter beijerinckii]SEI85028.1 outer membrane porin, OprD family [Azotobacter beijerinckii]
MKAINSRQAYCCNAVLLAVVGLLASKSAEAEFFEDSKTVLVFRNFYINRDYKGDNVTKTGNGRSGKAEEWTQNFILNFQSGYTEGPVGFGLDILALRSYKLDGGGGTSGTQALPLDRDGKPADEFGRIAVSGKMKFSKSELRTGEWSLVLPVLRADDARSLPQTFRGSMLTLKEIKDLTVYAGHITGNSPRDDGSMEDMTLFGTSPYTSRAKSDSFDFGGAEYTFNNKRTTVGMWYARLEDIYKQRYFEVLHSQPFTDLVLLNAKLQYIDGEDDGDSLQGHLDNKVLGGMVSLKSGLHSFRVGVQRIGGDSKWLRVNGTSGDTLVNNGYNSSYDNARERSWQVRYDYDFAGLGLPGLTLMTRYTKGYNIRVNGDGSEGKEWGRESELAYVIQGGRAKNLSLVG